MKTQAERKELVDQDQVQAADTDQSIQRIGRTRAEARIESTTETRENDFS